MTCETPPGAWETLPRGLLQAPWTADTQAGLHRTYSAQEEYEEMRNVQQCLLCVTIRGPLVLRLCFGSFCDRWFVFASFCHRWLWAWFLTFFLKQFEDLSRYGCVLDHVVIDGCGRGV